MVRRMGIWGFYWEVLRRAFGGRFWFAEKISGGFALFFGLVAQSQGWDRAMTWAPFWIFLAVFAGTVIVGLILAPYQIWRDENLDKERKSGEIKSLQGEIGQLHSVRPDLETHITATAWGGVAEGQPDIYGLIAFVRVTNKGNMPSVVLNWNFKFETNGECVRSGLTHSKNISFRPAGWDRALSVTEEDAIFRRTSSPIQTGGMAEGFAFCQFKKSELPSEIGSDAILTIFCRDVLGREYECSHRLTGFGSDDVYVPSAKFVGDE